MVGLFNESYHHVRNCIFSLIVGVLCATVVQAANPNIVVMLADDMGFGELQCLNPNRGKISTPHLDALAQNSLVVTDAHSGSSVCTPTRYGLLTGRYAWRTRLQSGVLTGGRSLIDKDRMTLAKLLSAEGYDTAIIGKWHLGMLYDGEKVAGKNVPVGARISQGPIDRGGFQLFQGFHHSRQMKLWVENDRVTEHLDPVEMLPRLVSSATSFIRSRKPDDRPFFLYAPWNSPHSPVVPSDEWKGKSGLNDHADFVMQTDDAFGQVVRALQETEQFANTLIICSSDNGTSGPTSKIADLHRMGHFPSGDFRGSKADIWDGGHRVPFIASWPSVITQPRKIDTLICLTDIFATVAELVGAELPDDAGEDSISFANLLRGGAASNRTDVVHHSVSGQFAIRQGAWKLICCPGSGGWSKPNIKQALRQNAPTMQLYNMSADPGEQENLAGSETKKSDELLDLLRQQIDRGRSTPGPDQANDAEKIIIEKWKPA